MKKLSLLLTMLSLLIGSALAGENVLVSCKIDDLSKFRNLQYGFGSSAIAGEYVLVENSNDYDRMSPTRLQIKRYRYIKQGDEIVRQGLTGRPMERIGYSKLGNIVTFSYMSFGGADHPDFQISTDGENSVMTYSQTGYADRDYSAAIQCTVHAHANTDAPDIDIDNLTDEELINTIQGMENKRSLRKKAEEVLNTDLMKSLIEKVDSYDFVANDIKVKEVRWSSKNKCEKLSISYYYNSVKVVTDYKQNIMGYVIPGLKCKNKVEFVRYRWNPDTGERYESVQERTPRIGRVILDKNQRILNTNSTTNPLNIYLSW